MDLFLEKTPKDIDIKQIKNTVLTVEGVIDIHHIHVWSMDGQNKYATMHLIANGEGHEIKDSVRQKLSNLGIEHITLELEEEDEICHNVHCQTNFNSGSEHHHHHHHH